MKKPSSKSLLGFSLAAYSATVVGFILFIFGPYLFISNAPTCIAQLYGDYRVQVFANPVNPVPGEEVELVAIVKTADGEVPRARVSMNINRGILPLYTSDPLKSGNGIYTFYYTFEEAGEYLVSFVIVDEAGTTVVDASLVVREAIPYENYVIPLVFLPIPGVIIFAAYIVSKTTSIKR